MAKRNITRAARAAYPSDLTDAQWAFIARLIPPAEPGGREREVDMHEIFNGIIYLLRSGCSWRMLPHDLPPWGTLHDYLRTKVRMGAGRHPISVNLGLIYGLLRPGMAVPISSNPRKISL